MSLLLLLGCGDLIEPGELNAGNDCSLIDVIPIHMFIFQLPIYCICNLFLFFSPPS